MEEKKEINNDMINNNLNKVNASEPKYQIVQLTSDQMKIFNKLLPVGYSLMAPSRSTRMPKKPLAPVFQGDEPQRGQRRKTRDSTLALKLGQEFIPRCKAALDLIKSNPLAGPFLAPVDSVALGIPDYFDIIKEPMDLGTISSKLSSGQYSCQTDFEADLVLVWNNALSYNSPNSPVHKMALELKDYSEKVIKEEPKKEQNVNRKTNYRQSNNSRFQDSNAELKKKTSRSNLSDRPLTIQEKKHLSGLIRQLPASCLWDVWRIVSPDSNAVAAEEMEFDIDTLPVKTARELEYFVRNKVNELQKKKNITKKGVFYTPQLAPVVAQKETSPSQVPTSLPSIAQVPQNADPDSSFISSLEDDDY